MEWWGNSALITQDSVLDLGGAMKKILYFLLIIAFLGAGAIAEAQQPKKIPRIGYLTVRSGPSDRDEAFRQGLRELGTSRGRTSSLSTDSQMGPIGCRKWPRSWSG